MRSFRLSKPTLALAAAAGTFAAAMLGHATPAAAVLIAGDTFEAADHPGGNRTVVTGGVNGIPFYTRNATGAQYAVGIVPDGGTNVLNHNDTTTGSGGNAVVGVLPQAVTLAATNDFITLSFNFRYTNVATATANVAGFRFGIEGSNGTPVTGDNQPATSDNDQGYYVQTGVGATAPNSTNVFLNESGGIVPILGGTDRAAVNTLTGGSGATFNDNNPHSAVFTITRTGPTAMTLSIAYDGGAAITSVASTTNIRTTFDEIAFGNGFVASPVVFNLDNIQVTSNVPEPASAGLAALGLTSLALRRRRRPRHVG